MKHLVTIIGGMLILASCTDDNLIQEQESLAQPTKNEQLQPGMKRVKVNSRAELQSIIDQLNDSPTPHSRLLVPVEYTPNEEEFVPLTYANYQQLMENLTEEEKAILENDEDELEYCPEDSIIADPKFCQLLNANREIVVADTVFRYLPNGIVYTTLDNQLSLNDASDKISTFNPQNNDNTPVNLGNGVTYVPVNYCARNQSDEIEQGNKDHVDLSLTGDGGYDPWGTNVTYGDINTTTTGYTSSIRPLQIKDNLTIPGEFIREVNYNSRGDGNWFHYALTSNKLIGRNIVAIKHFEKNKKLTMNFYEQHYLIYSNIGTKLKMQKKVLGIWWNIKADEMVQGWETVILKYRYPNPFQTYLPTLSSGGLDYPPLMENPFNLFNKNEVLFRIPFININFKRKDLHNLYKEAFNIAHNKLDQLSKNEAERYDKQGVYTFDNNDVYTLSGPDRQEYKNVKSVETKFFEKWLSGKLVLGFSYNGQEIKFKGLEISFDDKVDLYRGVVYGAICYKGRWLAARIIKDQD